MTAVKVQNERDYATDGGSVREISRNSVLFSTTNIFIEPKVTNLLSWDLYTSQKV
jgi:hypothetical protein